MYAPIFIFVLSVRTYPRLLVWMLKHQKHWYIYFKILWYEYQITNNNTYHHNNITTKSWIIIFFMTILQLKFTTQVTTNTRALIYLGRYGSVAKRISHMVFNIPYWSWKGFESSEEPILHVGSQLQIINRTYHYASFGIIVIQTNSWAGAMFWRSAWSPVNFEVKLPAPREALKTAGRSVEQKTADSTKSSPKSVELVVTKNKVTNGVAWRPVSHGASPDGVFNLFKFIRKK